MRRDWEKRKRSTKANYNIMSLMFQLYVDDEVRKVMSYLPNYKISDKY